MDSAGSTKAGLREAKKRRTESEILANGIRLFCQQGVRSARLTEVARASEVSPATLFNYYPNKGALAEAWVRGEIDDLLKQGLRERGEHGLRPTLRKVCQALSGLVSRDQVVRLEAWHETGRARLRPLSQDYILAAALAIEQERERVREDLSSRVIAEMLVDSIEAGVIAGLQAGETESELAKALRARVDLVLDGARKKNERVEAPVARR